MASLFQFTFNTNILQTSMAPDKAKAPKNPVASEDYPVAAADADDESSSDSEAEVPAAACLVLCIPPKRRKHTQSQGEHREDSPAADEETVCQLLKQLKLKDMAEGKAGFGGKHRKDAGDHKVPLALDFLKAFSEPDGFTSSG
jgi:hypothetical protein